MNYLILLLAMVSADTRMFVVDRVPSPTNNYYVDHFRVSEKVAGGYITIGYCVIFTQTFVDDYETIVRQSMWINSTDKKIKRVSVSSVNDGAKRLAENWMGLKPTSYLIEFRIF